MTKLTKITALFSLMALLMITPAFATGNGTSNTGKAKKAKDAKAASIVVIPGKLHGTYKLTYVSPTKQMVAINIVDAQGTVVHTDKVKNNDGFRKPYDLNNLKAGTYTFEVVDAAGTATHTVTYKKPAIAAYGIAGTNRCRLIVGEDFDEPLYIKVYGAEGKLLYKETVSTGQRFFKQYEIGPAQAPNTKGVVFKISTASQVLSSITL